MKYNFHDYKDTQHALTLWTAAGMGELNTLKQVRGGSKALTARIMRFPFSLLDETFELN
jgi:hypothetical protein